MIEEGSNSPRTGPSSAPKTISRSISGKPVRSNNKLLREPIVASIPTTIPMLKTLEPNTSPTENPGLPCNTEKNATQISGMLVITDNIANPTEASLSRVSLIKSSIDFMANRLAIARRTSANASTILFRTTSIIFNTLVGATTTWNMVEHMLLRVQRQHININSCYKYY